MLGEAIPCGNRTYEEFKKIYADLTMLQNGWLRDKCQWEHMTPWAVMQDFGVPSHDELKEARRRD